MTNLKNMVNQLCPNGIVYKKIGDIANYRRGSFPQPYTNSSYYGGDGAMPFVQVGDIGNDFRLVETTKNTISKIAQSSSVFVPKGTVLVTLQGSIGRVAITQYDSYVDRTIAIFEGLSSELNTKYFAYQLKNKFDYEKQFARGSTIKTITKNEMTEFEIPVPPLKIQEKIVDLLDKYAKLEGQLEDELKIELEAWENQYSFWLEKLCGGDLNELEIKKKKGDIKLDKLGNIGTLTRGKRFVKADSVEEGAPCIHYGELYTFYGISATKTKSFIKQELANKLRFAEKGDVVIVGAGENNVDIGIGVAWLGDGKPAIHDACYIFKHNLNPKYLSYYLRTKLYHNQLKSWVSEGKICAVSAKGIGESIIPIPSLREQEIIVEKLEKLEKYINEIKIEIPNEIALRKQQYEFYRNKILSI